MNIPDEFRKRLFQSRLLRHNGKIHKALFQEKFDRAKSRSKSSNYKMQIRLKKNFRETTVRMRKKAVSSIWLHNNLPLLRVDLQFNGRLHTSAELVATKITGAFQVSTKLGELPMH